MSNHKLFKISQQAILRNDDGDVLILRASNASKHWLLPGGRIEESDIVLSEALNREVMEETGLTIQIGEPIAVDSHLVWGTYAIAFVCTIIGDQSPVLSEEHSEYKWVSPSEIENYLIYDKIASAIAKRLG